MPSAVSLGTWEFKSFVPTWRTTLSGLFLRTGLTKYSVSSVVAPGKDLTNILLLLEMLQPRIFWMIKSPPINGYWFSCMLVAVINVCMWIFWLWWQLSALRVSSVKPCILLNCQLPCSASGSAEIGYDKRFFFLSAFISFVMIQRAVL